MITMNNSNRSFRYIAGGCFSACAVVVAIDIAQRGYLDTWALPYGIAYAIIAVSMFASLPILTAVGSVAYAFSAIRVLSVIYAPVYILELFLAVVFSVILFLAGLMKKNAKMLGLVAGSVAVFRFVLYIFFSVMFGVGALLEFRDWFIYPLMIIGAFMFGLASDENPNKAKILPPSKLTNGGMNDSVQSRVERLTRLKNLLDSGIISNEEFEAKKKLILLQ